MTATNNTSYIMPPREEVRCKCSHVMFDRIIIRSRALRVAPDGSVEGKCRCKRWLKLPLIYTGNA